MVWSMNMEGMYKKAFNILKRASRKGRYITNRYIARRLGISLVKARDIMKYLVKRYDIEILLINDVCGKNDRPCLMQAYRLRQ